MWGQTLYRQDVQNVLLSKRKKFHNTGHRLDPFLFENKVSLLPSFRNTIALKAQDGKWGREDSRETSGLCHPPHKTIQIPACKVGSQTLASGAVEWGVGGRRGCISYAQLFSHCRLFATPCTVVHQAPLSMGFSRQKY